MHKFKVKVKQTKKRLDTFLAEALKDKYSRSFIKQIIKEGFTRVNERRQKPSYILKSGDNIEFNPPPPQKHILAAEDIPLEIIYEDEDIVVVNKPSGMVVHPAAGNFQHTLVNALLFHCHGELSHLGDPLRPGVVHRLDKDVSGLIVLAKIDRAYRELVKGFKLKNIKRTYIAFVKGVVKSEKGEITLPIGRSIRDRKKMAVSLIKSKQASTYYQVLKRYRDYTKLQISLGTGRTHQIRVHLAYMGFSIIGDVKYGGPKAERIMLHAVSLEFNHPVSSSPLHFESPLPDEMKRLGA